MTAHDGIRVRLAGGPRIITDSPSEVFQIPRPPAWTESANCLSTDPDLFHVEGRGQSGVREARKICGNCDVREECLEWALEKGDRHAVLGGLTPRQRSRMAASRRKRDGGVRCKICDGVFPTSTPNALYCCSDCALEARRRQAARRAAS